MEENNKMKKKTKEELKAMSVEELIIHLNKVNKRIGDPPLVCLNVDEKTFQKIKKKLK